MGGDQIKVYSNNIEIYVHKYHHCDSRTTSKLFDGEYNLTRERATVCIYTHVRVHVAEHLMKNVTHLPFLRQLLQRKIAAKRHIKAITFSYKVK